MSLKTYLILQYDVINKVKDRSEDGIAISAKYAKILLEYIEYLEKEQELLCDELERKIIEG